MLLNELSRVWGQRGILEDCLKMQHPNPLWRTGPCGGTFITSYLLCSYRDRCKAETRECCNLRRVSQVTTLKVGGAGEGVVEADLGFTRIYGLHGYPLSLKMHRLSARSSYVSTSSNQRNPLIRVIRGSDSVFLTPHTPNCRPNLPFHIPSSDAWRPSIPSTGMPHAFIFDPDDGRPWPQRCGGGRRRSGRSMVQTPFPSSRIKRQSLIDASTGR